MNGDLSGDIKDRHLRVLLVDRSELPRQLILISMPELACIVDVFTLV